MVLDDLFLEYGEKALKSLTLDDIERLRNELPKVELSELKDKSDFKLYIELVKKFREYGVAGGNVTQGAGFQAWLTNTLSVGEDGIYADGETRFLFELIQNVDDCDYEDIASANLDIQFDFNKGEIVLSYNEKGFLPKDVFNITGIAEQSKNISAEKIEIGEKGIGFKSVFGIAEKVLIQSGGFSFVLDRGNFTVPLPSYDGFGGQTGTRLTLFIKGGGEKVRKLFESLAERYKAKNSLINKNPILFLNKLTKLKVFVDGWRQIVFSVDRAKPVQIGNGIEYEENLAIRFEYKVHLGGRSDEHSESICCLKYYKDFTFSREACVSRYSDTTKFQDKKMRFCVLFPQTAELDKIKQGSLYSFLPTQTVTTAPLIIHAPFKLAASRDYVDSQDANKWFLEAVSGVESLLVGSFNHLATIVKSDIVKYLPNKKWIFDGNDKVDCLRVRPLSRERLLDENLFICSDGRYRKAKEVCTLSSSDEIKDRCQAHRLANIAEPLFEVASTAGLSDLGIRIYQGIKDKIFFRALENSDISQEALEFLLSEEYKPDDELIKKSLSSINFSVETLRIISRYNYNDYKKVINNAAIATAGVSFDRLPILAKPSDFFELEPKHRHLVDDALCEIDRKTKFKDYWEKIKGNCYYCADCADVFYFATPSFLLVFGESPLKALELFARALDGSGMLTVALIVFGVSEQLDRLCVDTTKDNDEFFDLLIEHRGSLKRAFGPKAYDAYIKIIQDVGADKGRFLKEIIQNADDCEYANSIEPRLSISIGGQKITTESNEKGFTRKDIRAITAIGESTKNRLFGNRPDTIGEKGIGFKSVFGIAKSVTIRSSRGRERFDFSLSSETPTIPKKESTKGFESISGTKMEFVLKEAFDIETLSEEKIISICRCLRKLRQIEIGDIKISIKDADDGKVRIITIKNESLSTKQIKMRIVRHEFEINDDEAVADRTNDHSIEVRKAQTIFVYIPEKVTDNKGGVFPLYAGLPTSETINAPLYIDAPFDMEASRDHIHHNKWNRYIAEEVAIAVAKTLAEIVVTDRIGVLDYIPKEGELFGGKFSEYAKANFESVAKKYKLLPTLDKAHFAVPFSDLVYYPNFVRLLLERINLPELDSQKTIDFFVTRDYSTEKLVKVLEYLHCKQAGDAKILDIIERHARQYLSDKNIRVSIYSYLKNIPCQAKQALLYRIERLRIVPVKGFDDSKPIFVSHSEKPIWYGDNEKSTESYYILFTEWLTAEDYNDVFGFSVSTGIKEMNNAQRRAEYERKLHQIFDNKEPKAKYEWLIKEFQTSQQEMEQSGAWFRDNKGRLPLLRADNDFDYASNSIFKAESGVYEKIQGEKIKLFLVSRECLSLAEFLQLPSIEKIAFAEYSSRGKTSLSREDIYDLQNIEIFPYYIGVAILSQCKDAGYISDSLIKEFGLEGIGNSLIGKDDFEFPKRPVANIKRLSERIERLWKDEPIKVVPKEVKRTEYVGKNIYEKEIPIMGDESNQYAKQMYTAEMNSGICFCQLCQKPYPQKYIEVNKLEYLPNFYWEQLKLSFCLNCSKDFEMLRNNEVYGKAFIKAIRDYNLVPGKSEPILIAIGDKEVAFTATHFAEVQQILKVMRNDG